MKAATRTVSKEQSKVNAQRRQRIIKCTYCGARLDPDNVFWSDGNLAFCNNNRRCFNYWTDWS